MKLRVLWPGKTKKSYYRQAIDEYASRIGKLVSFELIETREESLPDSLQALRVKKESERLKRKRSASTFVLLDTAGKMMSSEEISQWLASVSGDVDFLMGGSSGFQISGETLRLSLGRITLPHELARVVLLEQIYRALTILKRLPYHK